jgi:hypothetical protein
MADATPFANAAPAVLPIVIGLPTTMGLAGPLTAIAVRHIPGVDMPIERR